MSDVRDHLVPKGLHVDNAEVNVLLCGELNGGGLVAGLRANCRRTPSALLNDACASLKRRALASKTERRSSASRVVPRRTAVRRVLTLGSVRVRAADITTGARERQLRASFDAFSEAG